MEDFLIGLGADAGMSIIGGIVQNLVNKNTAGRNYDYSMALSKYQNELAVKNWEMTNEYNSPSNQMKRLEAAGLNPLLIYGNSGNSGNAQPLQASNVGHYQQDAVQLQRLQSFMQYMMAHEQMEKVRTETTSGNLANQEQVIDLLEREMDYNSRQQFIADKVGGNPVFISTGSGRNGSNYVEISSSENQSDYYRQTPYYKQLEILWQKGVINEYNIGLLKAKEGLSGLEQKWQQEAYDILHGSGNVSGSDAFANFMKILIPALLKSKF